MAITRNKALSEEQRMPSFCLNISLLYWRAWILKVLMGRQKICCRNFSAEMMLGSFYTSLRLGFGVPTHYWKIGIATCSMADFNIKWLKRTNLWAKPMHRPSLQDLSKYPKGLKMATIRHSSVGISRMRTQDDSLPRGNPRLKSAYPGH